MSKTLNDFTPEEKLAWADHPITRAAVQELVQHRDAQAMALMKSAGSADERVIREAAGYHRGISAAIHVMGGEV